MTPERTQIPFMTSPHRLKQLQNLIWVLIYGGLLALVIGLSVQRLDTALGWALAAGGLAIALIGLVLIFVRARLSADPSPPKETRS
jgi:hypothetical protein